MCSQESAPNPRESAPVLSPAEGAKSKRGGRRPGSGAPRGNLNGLKHGLRSKQIAQLGLTFAANPVTRDALLALGKRHQLKQQKAEHVAALLLTRLIERGVKVRNEIELNRALKELNDRA